MATSTNFQDRFGQKLEIGDIVLIDGYGIMLGVVNRFTTKKIGVTYTYRVVVYARDDAGAIIREANSYSKVAGYEYKADSSLFNRGSRFIKMDDRFLDFWPRREEVFKLMEVKADIMAKKETK